MDIMVDGLTKRYGHRTVVSDMSFHLRPGVTGLLGPNGAGKSTLIKMLATVLPPTSGSVQYGAWRLPRDVIAIRSHLGYLPQEYGLYDQDTGLEFLTYAAAMKGVGPWRRAEEEARRLLELVGLDASAHKRLGQYSGGMRQRVGLAQSLIGTPDLLILDEPSAGLDPEERTRILNLVSMTAGSGSVLLSTHVVSDLEQLASTIVVMTDGHLVMAGPPEEIAAQARGRVFRVSLALSTWQALAPSWTARQKSADTPLVAQVQMEPDRVRLRVLAHEAPDVPEADIVAEPPTLSDGYLALAGTSLAAATNSA
jgi:ABC-type multidrug transport system ATPase subunit